MMPKLILLSISLFFISLISAQTTFSYGVKTGMNVSMNYGIKEKGSDYQVNSGTRTGMIAGAFLDLNVTHNLSLGYEVLYTMKGSHQKIKVLRLDEDNDGISEELPKPAIMNVHYYMDYIEIPVLLKVKALEYGRLQMHAVTGTAMALKVKGDHKLNGSVFFPNGDDFDEIPISEESDLTYINQFDYSFIYGGTLSYTARYTYFLEYRFTLGWDYHKLPTFADFPPVELRNQTYSLVAGVKF